MNKNIILLFGAFLMLGVLVLLESWRENRTFCMTRYVIRSANKLSLKKRKKLVMLSDLHNQCYGKENEKLLDAIRKEKPEMILIAGDMLVGKPNDSVDVAVSFVSRLTQICDVYYANGNHEQRMRDFPEKYGDTFIHYKKELVQAGVHFLENETAELEMDGQKVAITGLEIPHSYYEKFRRQKLPVDVIRERVGDAKEDAYQILLAHNPIYAESYLQWGADLVLSGHLHGGVARIPFFRGVITPQFGLFPKYSGECTEQDGKYIVVSKGLGTHTIPFRFLNPAEVIVLTLG